MSTISLHSASSARPRSGKRVYAVPAVRAVPADTTDRRNPARGLLVGLVAGAGLWVALLTGVGIL